MYERLTAQFETTRSPAMPGRPVGQPARPTRP